MRGIIAVAHLKLNQVSHKCLHLDDLSTCFTTFCRMEKMFRIQRCISFVILLCSRYHWLYTMVSSMQIHGNSTIPAFRLRDNSAHLHKCSPFWVGIFIILKRPAMLTVLCRHAVDILIGSWLTDSFQYVIGKYYSM